MIKESEIKKILSTSLNIIVDTREQRNHIAEKFQGNRKQIRVIRRKLDFGDYSFELQPNSLTGEQIISFEDLFAVERKYGEYENGGGFAELRNNLTIGHDRIKREFKRAEISNCNYLYLLLENTKDENSINNVPEPESINGKRIITNEQYIKMYKSFINNRNMERIKAHLNPIRVINCMEYESCKIIMTEFYKFFINFIGIIL